MEMFMKKKLLDTYINRNRNLRLDNGRGNKEMQVPYKTFPVWNVGFVGGVRSAIPCDDLGIDVGPVRKTRRRRDIGDKTPDDKNDQR